MLDPKLFDDLSRRIADNMPSGFQTLQDLQPQPSGGAGSRAGQLNLVTREFEIQQAVLLRTREKLRSLSRTGSPRWRQQPGNSQPARRARRPRDQEGHVIRKTLPCRVGIRAPRSRSKPISPMACRRSISSACRKRPYRKAATECAAPWSTAVSISPGA